MNKRVNISFLPIGKKWQECVYKQFEETLNSLPEDFFVEKLPSVFTEDEILDVKNNYSLSQTDLLLLFTMHGGSARQLVLAASEIGIPTVIWCHNQEHSLASSALAVEGLRRLRHPHILICDDDAAARCKLVDFANAAFAKKRLSNYRIGCIGPTHFNLISANVDPLTLRAKFGTWIVPISLSSVHSRIKSLRPERIIGESESLRKQYQVKIPPELFNKAVAIHLVLKDICAEQRLDAVAIDCWNETVPKFEVSPCLGFAENHYRIACEGDAVLALTLGLGEAICGQPGYCGDLYSIDEQKGLILLVHCGACADLHSSSECPRIVSKKLPGPINQKGTVITCHTTLPKGPATMVLLHGSGLSQLHIQRCEIISTEFSDQMKVTVLIEGDASDFLQRAAGNHYIVFPGDNVESWKIWAYWSGVSIQP